MQVLFVFSKMYIVCTHIFYRINAACVYKVLSIQLNIINTIPQNKQLTGLTINVSGAYFLYATIYVQATHTNGKVLGARFFSGHSVHIIHFY